MYLKLGVRDRLERSQRDTLREQIRVCYETALDCRDFNPKKRPASARDIIDRLHEMESIQAGEVASSTSGVAPTESMGKSNTDDPRVFRFVHPLAGQTIVMPRPAGPAAAGPAAYGLVEMKPPLPAKADEAFEKAWPSEAHSHSHDGLTKTRFNVYFSPKLMYLKVVAISAQDLIPSEKGRPLAPTSAKIQMGSQIRRTRPGQPQGSANPMWNEEFMFVASEPLEDPLVVTVEEHIASGRDEPIGRVIIPVASPYVPRNDLAKSVPSKWFSLSRGMTVEEVASKINLRLSLETEYHVLTVL